MRCNVGIDPRLLADQHLCELSELRMVPGSLRRWGYKPKKAKIPEKLCLGSGHLSFFYNKLLYLERRYEAVKQECLRRGRNIVDEPFMPDKHLFPKELLQDWEPTFEDTLLLRERVTSRLLSPPKLNFYRYEKQIITDMTSFVEQIQTAPLFTFNGLAT